MVVPGELFGQLEPAVIVGAADTLNDAHIEKGGEVAVGSALRQLGSGGQDFRDRQRSPSRGQGLDQYPAKGRVPLVQAGQPEADPLMDTGGRKWHHGALP